MAGLIMSGELPNLLRGRTAKTYRGGSARSRAPEETWAAIEPLLARRGITRVANITGLDHVGIPVYQAIRPNARSLSVSQGKGADPIAAKVSASMEALELSIAEEPPCPRRRATFSTLRREERARVIDPSALPSTRDLDPSLEIAWTSGVEIVSGEPVWIPFDLVHIDLTAPAESPFLLTSNGLASGNNLAEAVFHALSELVERDAAGLFALEPAALTERLVDLDAATDPGVRALVARLRAAGLTPVAWDMTTDIDLPSFRVLLFDTRADAALNPISAPYGAGSHIDPAVAMVRALTESAQSRVGWIAGSRDDLSRDAYRTTQSTTHELASVVDAPKRRRLDARPSRETPTVEEDIAVVLDALRRVGLSEVVVVPLGGPDLPVAVARVLVPGLEGPFTADKKPGRRAQALLARRRGAR